MRSTSLLTLLAIAVLCWNCAPQTDNTETAAAESTATETASEESSWQSLFDGSTLNGWHNYLADTIGAGWTVEDGAITLDPTKEKGGDILTDKTYENFELELEWKISECGNSGIFFNVNESPDFEKTYHTGPEMQVLDNTCHPDAKIETHRAGDLYDMIACSEETVLPAGQWNKVRLIVDHGKAEHWLNGKKVVTYEMFNDGWNEMIANSKFSEWEGFGQSRRGHIALQDHSDKVWFRNIRIREL